MYAIRSYYDARRIARHDLVERVATRERLVGCNRNRRTRRQSSESRITSYNVCYTKLLRIAADEALAGGYALDEIMARNAASILVLKPAALGGLRASQRAAARARTAGWGVVVTSTLDSMLGVAAALQLAAALPGPQLASGLATSGRFECDLADRNNFV